MNKILQNKNLKKIKKEVMQKNSLENQQKKIKDQRKIIKIEYIYI